MHIDNNLKNQGKNWLVFAPFIIPVVLVVLLALSPLTGIGPANNVYTIFALAIVGIGLVTGVVSLFLAKTIGLWWRVLIGALYLPTAGLSLLLAGL